MAEKFGFFNARRNPDGSFDRKYNANDYSEHLSIIISDGVLRSEIDDLKVTANGMQVSVSEGRAWIKGHWYHNDSDLSFAAVTAPIGGKRWDRVILRMNNDSNVRNMSLVYLKGEEADEPVKPALTRNNTVWELCLADIFVDTYATKLDVTDTRADTNVCGWVYSVSGDESFFQTLDNSFSEWFKGARDTLSSVSLFKRYNWRTVLQSAAQSVNFTIPQYDAEICFLEVFVNGLVKTESVDYTLSGTIVTFSASLIAGTEIEVKCYKSLDGTGIQSVADEITALQNQVNSLTVETAYTYVCNGIDDNVKLSEITENYLAGTTNASKIIRVYGTFGCSTPYAGAGTSANPYRWICVGGASATNRRLIFDFSGCTQISLPITGGTYNTVFYGYNAHIIGANISASQTASNTVIHCFNSTSGEVCAENCRFEISAHKDSRVGQTGTFTNCYARIANLTNNSYCFLPFTDSLLRINGGEYYAYGSSATQNAVVGQSAANAVTILNGVNAPKVDRSGYSQGYSLLQWAGGGELRCTDLVTTLPMVVVAGIAEIRGTVNKNKVGTM